MLFCRNAIIKILHCHKKLGITDLDNILYNVSMNPSNLASTSCQVKKVRSVFATFFCPESQQSYTSRGPGVGLNQHKMCYIFPGFVNCVATCYERYKFVFCRHQMNDQFEAHKKLLRNFLRKT